MATSNVVGFYLASIPQNVGAYFLFKALLYPSNGCIVSNGRLFFILLMKVHKLYCSF